MNRFRLIALGGFLATLSACSFLPTQEGWASVNSRVYYDGNGSASGSAPEDTVLHEAGTMVTVLSNTGALAKSGLGMLGWNTKADGSGTSYQAGDKFKMGTTRVTLYANWQATFSPRFHADDATSGSLPQMDALTIGSDSYTGVGNPGVLHKTGYVFKSWNTKADGTGTSLSESNYLYNVDETMTDFWIQWQPGVLIKYDLNGATETTPLDPTEMASDSGAWLQATDGFTKSHYDPEGWNTEPDGTGTSYVGYISAPTEDLTLYLEWSHQPGAHFDANGATLGTVPDDLESYYWGPLPGNTGSLSKTGFHFVGWNTTADFTGTSYLPGDNYYASYYATLFASWAPDQLLAVDGTFHTINTGSGTEAWYLVSLPTAGTYTFEWLDYFDYTPSGYTGNVDKVVVFDADTPLGSAIEEHYSTFSFTATQASTLLLFVNESYSSGTCGLKITGP